MEEFLKFIQTAKMGLASLDSYTAIHLVLGNESCDLDSTISALSLAYLIYSKNMGTSQCLVVPIMNVEAKYFPLRTETCYLLKKYGIDLKTLVFKDEIDYSHFLKFKKVKTSIVDHHVLSDHDKILEETVTQIFDHRTINNVEICKSPSLEKKIIKTVGSCATLIANEILRSDLSILFEELSNLLYATIIYDTIGLDKECGKTFDDDIEVAQHLERIIKTSQSRKELFDLLWKIHNDTSTLTSKDLLYRDLKIVKGILMPGLPMLVEDYLKREDAEVSITSFASEFNTSSVVLIGIDASKGVRRDLALFSTDVEFRKTLIRVLNSENSELSLTEVPTKNKNILCFRQGNIKLTRKFILPLVNDAASQCIQTQ